MDVKLTCFNLVLQGGRTIDEKLLKSQARIGNFEIQETHHVGGMMEIEHFCVSIIRGLDEIQQNVYHFHQEFSGRWITFGILRQDIWEQ